MRSEVRQWVTSIVQARQPKGPILEVGSLDINGTLRDLFPQEGYVGLDMRDGLGVDLVADILARLQKKSDPLWGKFNTAVIFETLEHTTDPAEVLVRMWRALRPGGLFIGSWCMAFPIHSCPGDYWRITPDGFRHVLEAAGFKDIEVVTEGGTLAFPVGVFATAIKDGRVPGLVEI